jgi:hypothetical protein
MVEATARRRASVGCAVRTELQPGEARERLVLPELPGQPAHGGEDRVLGRLRTGVGLAAAQHADAVELLRHVHEVEVAGEGPGDLLGALQRERGDELLRLRGPGRIAAVVGADRERAQALHVLVERGLARLAEHLTEQLAQQVDVGADPLVERRRGRPVGGGGCGGGGGCCGRGGRVGERRHGRDLSGGAYRAHDACVTIRTGMIEG